MGLIFLLIMISISSVLFKLINIKKPINKTIISPKPKEISKKQNKKNSPEIKSKIELKPVISKVKKDSSIKISENDTINQGKIEKEKLATRKSRRKHSSKKLKFKISEANKKAKQNNLFESSLKIKNLQKIQPTLIPETKEPELK